MMKIGSTGADLSTIYVDEIFTIYDSSHTNPDAIQYTKTIHNNLQFNPTTEAEGQINFLYLTITRKSTDLEISIFRKSTAPPPLTTFPNHPQQHKLAAYRHYIDRMLTLPLIKENQHKEWINILKISLSNNFPRNVLISLQQYNKE